MTHHRPMVIMYDTSSTNGYNVWHIKLKDKIEKYNNVFLGAGISVLVFQVTMPVKSMIIFSYCHDITEILLKVALNTIKQTNIFCLRWPDLLLRQTVVFCCKRCQGGT
jgi:hypothetical protein